ncbi:two-component sensor kinase [Salmonella enterica subsp. enterica]|uniref:Two-component sensor kinase n=1 Tax=Salmonella enterica I TaxID=59201 RepID=A0A379X286_SALET|nr:two-component sensor kinase [Salmonella enterica subsp. enterica]
MMDSVSQLLQLARVGQSFSSGNYQEVKLLEDVILPSYDELNTMLETRQQLCCCRKRGGRGGAR